MKEESKSESNERSRSLPRHVPLPPSNLNVGDQESIATIKLKMRRIEDSETILSKLDDLSIRFVCGFSAKERERSKKQVVSKMPIRRHTQRSEKQGGKRMHGSGVKEGSPKQKSIPQHQLRPRS